MKIETEKPTITVGDPKISLSKLDRTSRQKVNKSIKELNTINQLFNMFKLTFMEYCTWQQNNIHDFQGFASRLTLILSHKTNINKFKRIEITQRVCSLTTREPKKKSITE